MTNTALEVLAIGGIALIALLTVINIRLLATLKRLTRPHYDPEYTLTTAIQIPLETHNLDQELADLINGNQL